MGKFDYPDKIYAIYTCLINNEKDFTGGFWNTEPNPTYKGTPVEAIEYIRSDLANQLSKDELEGIFCILLNQMEKTEDTESYKETKELALKVSSIIKNLRKPMSIV